MNRFLLAAGLLLALLWARTAVVAVDYAEFAAVTRFGAPVAVVDGATDAGLRAKLPWPVDAVRRVDRRVRVVDLPAVETLTRDPAGRAVDKTLAVDATVTWRVPDAAAARVFVQRVGTPDQADRLLVPQVGGRLAAVVSTLPLDDLISVADDARVAERVDRVRRLVLGGDGPDGLRAKVRAEYGVEVVDLRVRRFGYPDAVRASIADRIRSDRALRVAAYEADGRRRAADILSQADKDARAVEADARARKQVIEGQADAEADRIRNDAHARDPEFYAFLQKLKAYQVLLSDTRDVLLLSTKHPLFDLLLSPPKAK